MIKRISCFLCILMIGFGLFRMDCSAAVIDPSQSCSLSLSYSRNGTYFSDLNVEIYRVAELTDHGTHQLLEPFSGYPINIHGITSQQEWKDVAQTIKNYVVANQVEPYRSQETDIIGQVYFTGLETGLYMVRGMTVQNRNTSIIFHDFMIYLPTPVGSEYNYNVQAKPKYTEYVPPVRHTVYKLWRDGGATEERPETVTVDILKNGEVQETVTLDHTNNWHYSWETDGSDGVWSVMEKDVPEKYLVSITNTQTVFMITNTHTPDDPDKPDKPHKPDKDDDDEPYTPPAPNPPPAPPELNIPKTGDTTPVLLYVMIACVSGFGLIILGILRVRERKDEKKR